MDILLALEKLGMHDNYASDCSTYEKMVATWRDSNVPIPTKADLQSASDSAVALYAWKSDMESFNLSREVEDLITEGSLKMNAYQKAIYDAKILRRSQPPY